MFCSNSVNPLSLFHSSIPEMELTRTVPLDAVREVLSPDQWRILRNAVAIFGAGFLLKWILKQAWQLSGGFCAFFLAPWGISRINLKKYGPWAVVTGASEGIGRGYALELARRGLNVVIMSRSQDKLQTVADEIRERYGREVRIIAVDFSEGQEVFPQVAEELKDLNVGILINNVGLSYEYPEYFLEVNEMRCRHIVELNCQTTVQMTRLLLPRMLERKGGIIVNLSTIGALAPCALLAVYTASKVFVNYFSDSLRQEYGSRGIIVQTVMPGLVATAMSNVRRVTYSAPSPETYARTAVATIGIQNTTFGYWIHAVQGYLFQLLPRRLYIYMAEMKMQRARVKLLKRRAMAGSQN